MKLNFALKIIFLVSTCTAFAKPRVLPSAAQIDAAVLGMGYDSVKEEFVGTCVRGGVQYAGASQGSLSFTKSLSAKETSDSLGFSVGGSARYGIVTASAAASFASESSSNEYSEVTVYSAEYHFKNSILDYTNELTDIGKIAHGSGLFLGDDWGPICGNEVVQQIQLGARLLISAKIEFATKADKQAFAAKFSIKGPAFSAAGELEKASKSFGKSASVTITAFQLGGDVSKLSSIFGAGSHATVDVDGKNVHALLVCSMDNMAACTQVLHNALMYASDKNNPDAFPNQIKPNYNPNTPDGPAELAYITKPWSTLGFKQQPEMMTAVIKAARADLSKEFESLLSLRSRVNALKSGMFRLSPRQLSNVKMVEDNNTENLNHIMSSVEVCYSDAQMCPAQISDMKKQLVSSTNIDLDIYPEIFAQWCDAADSDVLQKATKETVKRLKAIANTDIDLNKASDKCGTAQLVLEKMTSIDIGSYDSWETQVESLSPLASLINLEVLLLQHNQIEDLTPLSGLTKLRELNINCNDIRNLNAITQLTQLQIIKANSINIQELPTDLTKWTQLRKLEVASNTLVDLTPLKVLARLTSFYAGGNNIRSIDAISQLFGLQFLDLSYNKIKNFSSIESLEDLVELDVSGNPGATCPPKHSKQCFKMEVKSL